MGLTATVKKASSQSLPFADNSFDLVASCGGLNYTHNTDLAVREALTVLRPWGKLF